MEQSSKRGDLRTLVRVSFPLLLFLFCESLTTFGERTFLSYQGMDAVSGALNGSYLALLFQGPCVAVASMALVFVGLYQGKGELKQIGPCIWQLIWFSLFSLIITLPLGFWSASLYFKGTSIEGIGNSYFTILALGNFLFPLNTALTSFYIGRGKTMLVSMLMLASYGVNLMLCWVLVFGVKDLVPSLGVRGAALAKCLSLGLCCFIFFCLFLSKKNRYLYGTSSWSLSLPKLWSYVRPGIVRAFSYFWIRASWAVTSFLMIHLGGVYLDVQAVGGVIVSFLGFIGIGIYRSTLAIVPNLFGGGHYAEVRQLFRALIVYVLILGAILAIPLLLYPQSLSFFFDGPSQEVFKSTFNKINCWVWLHVMALAIQMGLCGFIVAARDLKMQFYTFFFSTLSSLLCVYICMQLWHCSPEILWMITAMENALLALIFFYRLHKRKWADKLTEVIQNKPT